jgi:Fur family ferric uptake transcriptional regulator
MAGKGLRVTREGIRVVEKIFALNEPFEAEQLVERMAQGQVRVSRSTIYRNLQKLEEAGLIRKVARHDDRVFFVHS